MGLYGKENGNHYLRAKVPEPVQALNQTWILIQEVQGVFRLRGLGFRV